MYVVNKTRDKPEETDHILQTIREKRWPYEEYYFGDKDKYNRKNGIGENHWTGAESIESYTGSMLHDTMHGLGDYRWRYKDPDGSFVTYEGQFYANRMHGYGVMSYADGRVFIGLFNNNVRWGPGIERLPKLHANVGVWRGTQLMRLTWRPFGPSIAPDLTTGPTGPAFVEPFRIVLVKQTKIIGETNKAIELLKHYGADPVKASEVWKKLYPVYCTDQKSALCHTDDFDHKYYKGRIHSLEQATNLDYELAKTSQIEEEDEEHTNFFAWNNSKLMLNIMKHSYKHDWQRALTKLDLGKILNGPRTFFRPAAETEYNARSLLMASFLGDVTHVTQLVNEKDVFPDIADMKGNTALMYAACGDEKDIIHFLYEAGANIDSYNDSCCTPLGVALMRLVCTANSVPLKSMVTSLLPPPLPKGEKPLLEPIKNVEWIMNRESIDQQPTANLSIKSPSLKKINKSNTGIKAAKSVINKTEEPPRPPIVKDHYDSDEYDDVYSEEKKLYMKLTTTYRSRRNDEPAQTLKVPNVVPYLFDSIDMTANMDMLQLVGKGGDKSNIFKKMSKLKQPVLPPAELNDKENSSANSNESIQLLKIQETIAQLLKDGADPRLVRCPQTAIVMATKSRLKDIIRLLVSYGADVNEKFSQFYDQTVLDMVISERFSTENVGLVKTLLEMGADPNHRLQFNTKDPLVTEPIPGPTLLHLLVCRRTDFQFEDEIRESMIDLLLNYRADPFVLFQGESPVSAAMNTSMTIFEVFVNNSFTDLNSIVNESNQCILVKFFSREFFRTLIGTNQLPILTSMLLYGADPLLECFNSVMRYGNVFEFAKKVLTEIVSAPDKSAFQSKNKMAAPDKKATGATTTPTKNVSLEEVEYRGALNLMTECARMLHVRWLQAKLMKELVDIIYRYKHRHWSMIIKEHKQNRDNVGLWLTASRCLEIWSILETTKKKKYNDRQTLLRLLCMVHFYQKRLQADMKITPAMLADEKNMIEAEVEVIIKEYNVASNLAKEAAQTSKRPYVKPELAYKADDKFQVCFDCALRLDEERITCEFCNLISFCNISCLIANVERENTGHPCSENLKEKYAQVIEDIDISELQPDL